MIKKFLVRAIALSLLMCLMSFSVDTVPAPIINDELIIDKIDTSPHNVDFENIIDHNYYIGKLARRLGVEYSDLFALIAFETGGTFDPKITNPYSGARGLIQFTNATATTLLNRNGHKFNNVNELIKEYPTEKEQLALPSTKNRYGGPVYQYLIRFGKFKNKRELYLSVFYPNAINWSDDTRFPEYVISQNPRIHTVGDYVASVEDKIKLNSSKTFD